MNKTRILPTIVLTTICLISALLLALVNSFTSPLIEKNKSDKANAALAEVYPGSESFDPIDLSTLTLPTSVELAYKTSDGGFVIRLNVRGYQPGLVIMCGVDPEGRITGAKYLESNETNGAEDKLAGAYDGKSSSDVELQLIAGSTKTSEAYHQAIVDALNAAVILNGGSVDLRDPQQILQDQCNAALGTEGKTFTKWFATEVLEGVDSLYVSDAGVAVFLSGSEDAIGIKNGAVVTASVSEENASIALAAYTVYESTLADGYLTAIDFSAVTNKNLLGAYKTTTGNFVFDVQAKGYDASSSYSSTLEYIKIRVAISKDGVIISTLTVSENESEGVGDFCADPDYYESYNGKNSENYVEVDGVSGATITSDAYKRGIKLVFDAYKALKGDA